MKLAASNIEIKLTKAPVELFYTSLQKQNWQLFEFIIASWDSISWNSLVYYTKIWIQFYITINLTSTYRKINVPEHNDNGKERETWLGLNNQKPFMKMSR